MQSLTRISEQIHSGRAQWRALVEMRTSGETMDKAEYEEALGHTVAEMIYFVGQNLRILNHQTATEFGNVENMRRKLRQNKFYGDSVRVMIVELDQLDAFLDLVDREGMQFGMFEMRNFLTGQLKPKMGEWRHLLNEIQAVITHKLFVRRQIDGDLRLLFDAALWMESNPTLNGLDVELGQSPNVSLLRPTPIRVRSHYDVFAKGAGQEKVMQAVASKLPPPKDRLPLKTVRPKQVVLSTEVELDEEVLSPEDVLVQELIAQMRGKSQTAFEILGWERERRITAGIGDEEWLFYATQQLEIAGVVNELQFIRNAKAGTFNEIFDDVMVFGKT